MKEKEKGERWTEKETQQRRTTVTQATAAHPADEVDERREKGREGIAPQGDLPGILEVLASNAGGKREGGEGRRG